ncbi:MAG: cell division protein FtsA [Firmicutes bacterium]|nr:cell division protein FtsA [Bacillota bacterium]
MPKNTVVAVDMGTSKISCLIAEYSPETGLEIIGRGHTPSHGIKAGVVTDLKECARALELAVIEAENSAGMRVNSVFAGITGEHIQIKNNKAKIDITGKGYKITAEDVTKVVQMAGGISLTADRKILHVIPRGFCIDGYIVVDDPVGMQGKILEVDAFVVTGAKAYMQNINLALEMSELELEKDGYIYSTIAAAGTVLKDEEKKVGILLVDIGAGTTKIAAYKGGSLISCRTIPIAGDKITYDIALTFKIPLSEAERLKVQKGSACADRLNNDEQNEIIEAEDFADSGIIVDVQRKLLAQTIEARLMDIFELVGREVRKLNEIGIIPVGVILTGGTARLKDIHYLASRVLELRVRVGKPINIAGLKEWEGNPEFAGVVGALNCAITRKKTSTKSPVVKANISHGMFTSFKRVWDWVIQAF